MSVASFWLYSRSLRVSSSLRRCTVTARSLAGALQVLIDWPLETVILDARIPEASYDLRVIVLCQEGYTSSLAADSLVRLGIRRATDVVGGFAVQLPDFVVGPGEELYPCWIAPLELEGRASREPPAPEVDVQVEREMTDEDLVGSRVGVGVGGEGAGHRPNLLGEIRGSHSAQGPAVLPTGQT